MARPQQEAPQPSPNTDDKPSGWKAAQQAEVRAFYNSPEQVARREREEARRKASLWENAGIPSRFKAMTLESSPLATSAPALIGRLRYPDSSHVPEEEWGTGTLAETEATAAWDSWNGSWFLWGDYGVGKTGLAVGLAREYLDHGASLGPDGYSLNKIIFATAPAMLTRLRSTYGRDSEETEASVLAEYTQVDALLILDDLGGEQVKGTGWVEDRLYQVIGDRHGNEVPTIFTSNMSLQELAGRIGERICWRILEMCGTAHIVHVEGPNLRELPA